MGLTSTCTNPVLYAFFNENLRKEFEFFIDCICPSAFSRSRLSPGTNITTNNTQRSALPNNLSNRNRRKNDQHELRPRRDGGIVPGPSIDLELDPTIHKETGDEIDCDCLKDFAVAATDVKQENIEMAPLSTLK